MPSRTILPNAAAFCGLSLGPCDTPSTSGLVGRWSVRSRRGMQLLVAAEEGKSWKSACETYLASPTWQSLRPAVSARDGHSCRVCDSPDDFEAHHRHYPPWSRWDLDGLDALLTLCHASQNCIMNGLRSRAHRDGAAPALSDIVRLTPTAPQEIKHEPLSDPSFSIIGASLRCSTIAAWPTRWINRSRRCSR